MIFGFCKSCWCLKCLVSCFKYFHLKHARRSLAPLYAFSKTQDSAFTGKSPSKILAVLCPKPTLHWHSATRNHCGLFAKCSVGGHHCRNHTMLLVVLTANSHSNNDNKKNPNYHNLCIFHPFSHKAIYNIIQYFRKTRHFKVYENILLHQIYSGKLSPSPTAT